MISRPRLPEPWPLLDVEVVLGRCSLFAKLPVTVLAGVDLFQLNFWVGQRAAGCSNSDGLGHAENECIACTQQAGGEWKAVQH